MGELLFLRKCNHKMDDGSNCATPASHYWGPAEFCCLHFDGFIEGLFGLKDAVREEIELRSAERQRSHTELLEEYNRRTKKTSTIPGAPCDSEKPK